MFQGVLVMSCRVRAVRFADCVAASCVCAHSTRMATAMGRPAAATAMQVATSRSSRSTRMTSTTLETTMAVYREAGRKFCFTDGSSSSHSEEATKVATKEDCCTPSARISNGLGRTRVNGP